MNSTNFSFEEETFTGTSRQKNHANSSFAQLLIRISGGIIKTETQANLLLIGLSVLLISFAIYNLETSSPPLSPPHLNGVSDEELEAYRAVQPF